MCFKIFQKNNVGQEVQSGHMKQAVLITLTAGDRYMKVHDTLLFTFVYA